MLFQLERFFNLDYKNLSLAKIPRVEINPHYQRRFISTEVFEALSEVLSNRFNMN